MRWWERLLGFREPPSERVWAGAAAHEESQTERDTRMMLAMVHARMQAAQMELDALRPIVRELLDEEDASQ